MQRRPLAGGSLPAIKPQPGGSSSSSSNSASASTGTGPSSGAATTAWGSVYSTAGSSTSSSNSRRKSGDNTNSSGSNSRQGRGSRRDSQDAVVPVSTQKECIPTGHSTESLSAAHPSSRGSQPEPDRALNPKPHADRADDLAAQLPRPRMGPWSHFSGADSAPDSADDSIASMPGCIEEDVYHSAVSYASTGNQAASSSYISMQPGTSTFAGSTSSFAASAVPSTSGRPDAGTASLVTFAAAPQPNSAAQSFSPTSSPRSDGINTSTADGRLSPITADTAQQRAKSRLARSTLAGGAAPGNDSSSSHVTPRGSSEPSSTNTSAGGTTATGSGRGSYEATAGGSSNGRSGSSSHGTSHSMGPGNSNYSPGLNHTMPHAPLHSMASTAAMLGLNATMHSPRASTGGGLYAPPTVSGLARLRRMSQTPIGSGAMSRTASVTLSALSQSEAMATMCSLEGRRVRVHVVTFNMNSKVPEELPDALVGSHKGDVDLYVFGSQESGPIPEWERAIHDRIGEEYERYASESIWGIHLVVFAHTALLPHLGPVKSSSIATGIGNVLGNKGGAALSFTLGEARLLFVCAHFAAHDDKVERRNANYHRIRTGLFSSAATNGSGGTGPSAAQKLLGLKRAGGSVGSGLFQWGSMAAGGLVSERSGSWTIGATASLSAWDRNAIMWAPPTGTLSSAPSATSDSLASDSLTHELEGSLRASSCPNSTQRPAGDALRMLQPLRPLRPSGYANSEAAQSRRSSTAGSDGDSNSRPGSSGCPSEQGQSQAGGLARAGASGLWRSLVGGSSNSAPVLTFSDKPDATEDHDITFWLGDLNYRINGNKRSINYLIRSRLHEVLHANDQLRIQQKKGRVFQGYHEAPIHFPPTFKLQPRTTRYSEQRIPSWTDRILWKVRHETTSTGGARTTSGGGASSTTCHVQGAEGPIAVSVKHTYYQSVPECDSSDHRPVVAGFDLMMAAEGNVAAALVSDGGAGGAGKDSVLSKAGGCTIM